MSRIIRNVPRLLVPERLAALREKVDQLRIAEDRERYESNLSEFVKGAWSSIDSAAYQDSWVIDCIADHLEAVTLGQIKRILFNVPPRAGKTSVISIIYPAWTWARSEISYLSGPQVKFLCASYNDKLSLDISNKARRLFYSPWFQRYWPNRIILQGDQNTKHQFDNTFGGSRIATSVSGGLLGIGGDSLIADDLNNTEVVESEAERSRVKTFWDEFHTTRLNNQREGAIVVVQQRTHVGDVSGVILEGKENFTHVCVPMRYDERRHCVTVSLPQYDDDAPWEDPRSVEGELMWPERFNDDEIKRMEDGLGPFLAAGRLQQSPIPKGGGIIKRDWWQPWTREEARSYGLEWGIPPCDVCKGDKYVNIGGRTKTCQRCNGTGEYGQLIRDYPKFNLIAASLDTSYGEKETNDFNACTVWGIWVDKNKNKRAMLVFAWNKRLPLHGKVVAPIPGEAAVQYKVRQQAEWGLVEWVADTCKKFKVDRLLIEDKTRGRDVANEITRLYARENWGVQLINPTRDKVSRAHSIVPMFVDGAVWAPQMKWADDLVISQCELFPKDVHDDLVDSTVQFLLWAREHEILTRADEAYAALEDEMAFKPRQESVAAQYGV